MRRLLVFVMTFGLLLPLTNEAVATAPPERRPDVYVVSRMPGTTLEGIAVTPEGTMFVTSIGTGGVFIGSVRQATLRPFVPAGADGRSAAAGVHVDHYGRVFVAGFDTGVLYAYGRDGQLQVERSTRSGAALNDFVFTDDAVYVTDSNLGIVWRARLSGRQVGPLTPWLTPDRFSVSPNYLNGIVASPDGRFLLVADQGNNVTYRVNVARRTGQPITVSGADGVFSADGMVLEGADLYGVYNYGATVETARWVLRHVHLSRDLTRATWVSDSASVGADQTPTTVARDHCRFLWVNSQLSFAPGHPPYTVGQVPDGR